MIKKECFSKDWIDSFKKQKEHKVIQAPILEKMIYVLHLLELLKAHGLGFVFKGGTSLILLLKEENRFSVDLDIICPTDRATLEKTLDSIVEESVFSKVELDEKRSYKEGVPKAHYVFEFNSVYNQNVPGKLLLDILIEKPIYPVLVEVPVTTKWIETDNLITVSTPSIDSITGDKLTAFAPNTIGIPYYKGEDSFAMEICKQLFDLGKLFPAISNMEVVKESYHAFVRKESGYRSHNRAFRERGITPEDVLRDSIDTCILIAKRDANKEEPYKTQFADMDRGIRAFGANFLMTGNFRIEDAVIASARIAHLSAKLIADDLSPVTYYNGEDIKPLTIEHTDWNFLNKLRKQPDKSSFFYWYYTVQLLTTVKT